MKNKFKNNKKILINFIRKNTYILVRLVISLWQLYVGIITFISQKISKFNQEKKPRKIKHQISKKHQPINRGKLFYRIKRKLKCLFFKPRRSFETSEKDHIKSRASYNKTRKNQKLSVFILSVFIRLKLIWVNLFPPRTNKKPWRWRKFIMSAFMTFILTLQFTGINWWYLPKPAYATVTLAIEPLTWDFVGLDSNKPDTQGPNDYLVGARVCNMGDEPATNVQVKYYNDGVDNGFTFINIATDTLELDYLPPNDPSIPGTIAATVGTYIFETGGIANATKYNINFTPTNCSDFYINFDVTRTTDAWHTVQKYYLEATATNSAGNPVGSVRTPQPRQTYIEQLISQARNEVLDFYCNVAGGPDQRGTVNVSVGDVMECTTVAQTATAYPQLSLTANFPNIIFQMLNVTTSYSNPTGGENSAVYADGCGWVQDPTSPDYHRSPTNCAGPGWPGQYINNSGGEGTGETIVTKYTVKVLSQPVSPGPISVSNIILDFSGGSFHYNADYGTGICPTINCINIVVGGDNTDLSITKTHTGNFTLGANQYTMTITDNANGINAKDIRFFDTLPLGYSFNEADILANDGGGDGDNWYCIITDPTSFSGDARRVVCDFNNGTFLDQTDDFMLDGSSQDLVFNVNVAVPPAATNSTNVGCVEALNDNNEANNCDNDPTTIVFGPNIRLTKDDDDPVGGFGSPDETFVAGATQTYNFLVEKTTDDFDVNGPLTLVDTLPTGISFVSDNGNDGWSCSASGQIVTCTRATGLTGVGASTQFAIDVNVSFDVEDSDPVTAGTQAYNTATVISGSSDVNPADNTDDQINTVDIPAPDLTIDKTDFGLPFIDVNSGTEINSIYLFTITNKDNPATITTTAPLVFQDILPAYFDLVSAGNAPGSTGWTCTPAGPLVNPNPATAVPLGPPSYNDGNGTGITVDCTNPNPLAPGDSTQIEIVVTPNFNPPGNGGSYVVGNRATVITEGETNIDITDDPESTGNICTDRAPAITTENCEEEITTVIDSTNSVDMAVDKRAYATVPPAAPTAYPDPLPASVTTLNPGDTIYYSIFLNSTSLGQGNTDIEGTGTFTDTIPAGITVTGATCSVLDDGTNQAPNRCCGDTDSSTNPNPVTSLVGNTITCDQISLRKGAVSHNPVHVGEDNQIRIDVVGTIDANFSGFLTNTGVGSPGVDPVDGPILDEDPTNNRDTVVVFVPGSDVSLNKDMASFAPYTVGTDNTYTLTVTNEEALGGLSTNGLITVRDILPTELDFVSVSGAGWICDFNDEPTSPTFRYITCTTDQVLAPQGTSTINITVNPNTVSASVTNPASVQYGGDPLDDSDVGGTNGVIDDVDGDGVFDSGTDDPNSNDFDEDTIAIVAPNVDLRITKTATTAFQLGQQATYQINVTNHNVGGATNAISPITVTDQLPPGVNFVFADTTAGSPWICSNTTDALPDNNSNGIVDGGDGDGTDDGFETVTCTRYTDITPNETATFDLNVLVTANADTAAPIRNEVRVTSSSDVCLDFTNGNCDDTNVGNPANDTNGEPNDNKAFVDVAVAPSSDLAITKTAISSTAQNDPPQFLEGNTETFEIEVVNNGPSDYSTTDPIEFTDTLDSNFTFVATGSGGDGFSCSAVGQVVTCTKATGGLTAGDSATVIINVLVADPTAPAPIADTGADVAGDNIDNTATITGATLTTANDSDNTNDSSTETIDLEGFTADIKIQKDDGDGESPDEPVSVSDRAYFVTSATPPVGGGTWQGTYTLEVENLGPAIATYPLRIQDTLPAGLTYNSSFGVGWDCSASLGLNIDCTYDIDTDKNGDGLLGATDTLNLDDFLDAGENTGVAIIVDVASSLLPTPPTLFNTVTNDACVTSGTPDPDNPNVGDGCTAADGNNHNSEITLIREVADLSVSKSDDNLDKMEGDVFRYSITIHNDSVDSLGNPVYQGTIPGPIYATDYFPEGLVYQGGLTTDTETGGVSCAWNLLVDGGNFVSFTCNDDLPYGATSTFSFNVLVDTDAQSIERNLVRVSGNVDEPDNPDETICDRTDPPLADRTDIEAIVADGRTNNCAIEETPVVDGENADLLIEKQAGIQNNDNPPVETLNIGDPFSFTFTVNNFGADDSQQVRLEDVLPNELTPTDTDLVTPGIQIGYTINNPISIVPYDVNLDSVIDNNDTVTRTCTYNSPDRTFACSLNTVDSTENGGNAIVITLQMSVTSGSGIINNEATLESSTSDNNSGVSPNDDNNCTVNNETDTGIINCDIEAVSIAGGGGTPNMILVKRITGVYRDDTPIVTNPAEPFSVFNDQNPSPDSDGLDGEDDNEPLWPSRDRDGVSPAPTAADNVHLRGAVDGGEVESDDEIEFTVYYLNKGNADASNVTLCDLVPANLDFVEDAYGSGRGIALVEDDGDAVFEDPIQYLTNAISDGADKGNYFEPNTDPSSICTNFTTAQNTDGIVGVEIGTVPFATVSGVPSNSYGFIRFRATVR